MYVEEDNSVSQLLEYINARYTERNGRLFHRSTISDILSHPVYAGYIRWNRYTDDKQKLNKKENWIVTKGVHQPLMSEEMWQKAQEKRSHKAVRRR